MTIKRSRAELFSYLGAPLNNVQWSWGAVRETDGSVFLVVWQDENLRRGLTCRLSSDLNIFGDGSVEVGC